MNPQEHKARLSTYSKEHQAVITDVFKYEDQTQLTAEDTALLKETFTKPEAIAVLRKFFRIHTPSELGIYGPAMSAKMEGDIDFQMKLMKALEARIMEAMAQLYFYVQDVNQAEEMDKIDDKIAKEKAEEENAETIKEELRTGGENL